MRGPRSLASTLPFVLAFGACGVSSCDDKGITSLCPLLPLDSNPDASSATAGSAGAEEVGAARAAAVDAGCITPPMDFGSGAGAGGDFGDANPAGSAGEYVAAAGSR